MSGGYPDKPDFCPDEVYTLIMEACWAYQPHDRPLFDELVKVIQRNEIFKMENRHIYLEKSYIVNDSPVLIGNMDLDDFRKVRINESYQYASENVMKGRRPEIPNEQIKPRRSASLLNLFRKKFSTKPKPLGLSLDNLAEDNDNTFAMEPVECTKSKRNTAAHGTENGISLACDSSKKSTKTNSATGKQKSLSQSTQNIDDQASKVMKASLLPLEEAINSNAGANCESHSTQTSNDQASKVTEASLQPPDEANNEEAGAKCETPVMTGNTIKCPDKKNPEKSGSQSYQPLLPREPADAGASRNSPSGAPVCQQHSTCNHSCCHPTANSHDLSCLPPSAPPCSSHHSCNQNTAQPCANSSPMAIVAQLFLQLTGLLQNQVPPMAAPCHVPNVTGSHAQTNPFNGFQGFNQNTRL